MIKGSVNIQVGDVNDNAPRFHNQPYSVRIPEVRSYFLPLNDCHWHGKGTNKMVHLSPVRWQYLSRKIILKGQCLKASSNFQYLVFRSGCRGIICSRIRAIIFLLRILIYRIRTCKQAASDLVGSGLIFSFPAAGHVPTLLQPCLETRGD